MNNITFGTWQPINTAPRDGTWILLAGDSGYTATPLRVEVGKYDAKYRPLQPWITHSHDSFCDGGPAPIYWHPLLVIPSKGNPLIDAWKEKEAKVADELREFQKKYDEDKKNMPFFANLIHNEKGELVPAPWAFGKKVE